MRLLSFSVLSMLAACGAPRGTARPLTATIVDEERVDGDGDGVAGAADLCPDDVEDRDAFEDGDGCPDPDNDQDQIADANDHCPNEAETYNGYEDEDGCPDTGEVVITEIACPVILDKIYFRHRSAVIGAPSGPILDALAAAIRDNASIERVAVVGATARNERNAVELSRARADAVRKALELRGVPPERLEVVAAANRLDLGGGRAGFERNRRVELTVLRAEGTDVDVVDALRPLLEGRPDQP